MFGCSPFTSTAAAVAFVRETLREKYRSAELLLRGFCLFLKIRTRLLNPKDKNQLKQNYLFHFHLKMVAATAHPVLVSSTITCFHWQQQQQQLLCQ